MKKFLSFFLLLPAVFAMAQSTITVKFTGIHQDGSYCRLDSVKATNVAKGWSQTLVYPDTTLVLTCTDGVSELASNNGLSQNYPNPFHGTTEAVLTLNETENACIQIVGIDGRVIVEKNAALEQGEHRINVSLAEPRMAMLRVTTANYSFVIKMLNLENGDANAICISSVKAEPTRFTKNSRDYDFSLCDQMKYEGYANSDASPAVQQQQCANGDVVLTFSNSGPVPEGALSGKFSVSATKQVYFSKGNLQFTAAQGTHSVADGGTAQGTWRFAENQWNFVGSTVVSNGTPCGNVANSSNHLIAQDYNGWIDLFGFGTSGWNSGATAYMPWSTDNVSSHYCPGGQPNDLTGDYAYADWGVYNAISNGGDTPGIWRTLKGSEWRYVMTERETPSGIRFVMAQVNGVDGCVILPDNWQTSIYTLNNANTGCDCCSDNQIDAESWTNVFEANGAVFLPAAGSRLGSAINNPGLMGGCWTASHIQNNNGQAAEIQFGGGWSPAFI